MPGTFHLRRLVFASLLAPAALPGCASSCDPGGASAAASSSSAAAEPPVPSLDVPHLLQGEAITIDGDCSEAAWVRAASTPEFVNVGTGGKSSETLRGRAKLLWDDTFLYVGIDVNENDVRGGFPQGSIDAHLWERDTVEVMIDPDGDGDGRDYYEIQVSPQNLVFDSQFDDYNLPRGGDRGPFGHEEWSSKLISAIRLSGSLDDDGDIDDGYRVEMQIPWTSLERAKRAPPAADDVWRMNLYAMRDNSGVAWSPILGKGNFHRASRFGRVRFVK